RLGQLPLTINGPPAVVLRYRRTGSGDPGFGHEISSETRVGGGYSMARANSAQVIVGYEMGVQVRNIDFSDLPPKEPLIKVTQNIVYGYRLYRNNQLDLFSALARLSWCKIRFFHSRKSTRNEPDLMSKPVLWHHRPLHGK